MQSVDFTTLSATCAEIAATWLPARLEQVYQIDRQTIALYLRTFDRKGWLIISWHPQGARLHIGDPPPKVPDTFTFSDQLRHQLNGFALTKLAFVAPWERVIDLQFAQRPDDPALGHLYIEIMGKYSNVILTAADNQIVTVAHQVNATQSSVRTVQTGQIYQLPPVLLATNPSLEESLSSWQARVSLIPKTIEKQLVSTYRGVSPVIARSLLQKAKINPKLNTDQLDTNDWEKLFSAWQEWLKMLENKTFQPGWTSEGYTVIGGEMLAAAKNVQELLNRYYSDQINQESFRQLQQKLNQKITS
ncbi:MAG: NFACT family protein, partial [Microcystis sp. M53599_WE4]|nr:NFACT family protein [Microcystis sp. M53599_WE4]